MKEVIIALDFHDAEETFEFLDQFNESLYVKIGMELFNGEGPSIVREIKARGHKIFLDLKLHDIPTTVEKAMRNLGRLGVDLTNVHAAGGYKMMAAAKKGLHDGSVDGHEPKLIAVTQLTSTSSLMLKDELLVEHSMQQTIVKYAQNAKRAGLDGVVCSPLESPMIHEACGMEFLTCTPGIRFTSNSSDDQVRVTTPYKAHRLGSDYIVVGRSITKADNPVEAYREAVKQFVEGIKEWKN